MDYKDETILQLICRIVFWGLVGVCIYFIGETILIWLGGG